MLTKLCGNRAYGLVLSPGCPGICAGIKCRQCTSSSTAKVISRRGKKMAIKLYVYYLHLYNTICFIPVNLSCDITIVFVAGEARCRCEICSSPTCNLEPRNIKANTVYANRIDLRWQPPEPCDGTVDGYELRYEVSTCICCHVIGGAIGPALSGKVF